LPIKHSTFFNPPKDRSESRSRVDQRWETWQRTNSEKVAIPRKKFNQQNFFLEYAGTLHPSAVSPIWESDMTMAIVILIIFR
jgi:hypothetical protein